MYGILILCGVFVWSLTKILYELEKEALKKGPQKYLKDFRLNEKGD